MLISHPELVHQDRAKSESGGDLGRQKLPEDVYTGIWWYARFPNHYSGDGSLATREFGQFRMNAWIDGIVKATRAVKADQESLRLQNEFFEKALILWTLGRSKRPSRLCRASKNPAGPGMKKAIDWPAPSPGIDSQDDVLKYSGPATRSSNLGNVGRASARMLHLRYQV